MMRYVTLSWDDGFEDSFTKAAEIYEKFGLRSEFNIVATASLPGYVPSDKFRAGARIGDFSLWNEMQARGHTIQPHGYTHANKQHIPFSEAKDSIQKCLDVFSENLDGFDPKNAIFNFPYNASTPELEEWLPTVVRAFRTSDKHRMISSLPGPDTVKVLTSGYGPENGDEKLEALVDELLEMDSGWLVYNTHGLDGEGWGPISTDCLNRLLEKLAPLDDVKVLPVRDVLDIHA